MPKYEDKIDLYDDYGKRIAKDVPLEAISPLRNKAIQKIADLTKRTIAVSLAGIEKALATGAIAGNIIQGKEIQVPLVKDAEALAKCIKSMVQVVDGDDGLFAVGNGIGKKIHIIREQRIDIKVFVGVEGRDKKVHRGICLRLVGIGNCKTFKQLEFLVGFFADAEAEGFHYARLQHILAPLPHRFARKTLRLLDVADAVIIVGQLPTDIILHKVQRVQVGEFLVALREFAFTLQRNRLFEGLGVFLLDFARLLGGSGKSKKQKYYYENLFHFSKSCNSSYKLPF